MRILSPDQRGWSGKAEGKRFSKKGCVAFLHLQLTSGSGSGAEGSGFKGRLYHRPSVNLAQVSAL